MSDIIDAFPVVQEALPQPDAPTVVAYRGIYTNAQVHEMNKQVHENILNQMYMLSSSTFSVENFGLGL